MRRLVTALGPVHLIGRLQPLHLEDCLPRPAAEPPLTRFFEFGMGNEFVAYEYARVRRLYPRLNFANLWPRRISSAPGR